MKISRFWGIKKGCPKDILFHLHILYNKIYFTEFMYSISSTTLVE